MPEDSNLVERYPSLGFQIRCDARAPTDTFVQSDDARIFLFKAPHRFRKCVTQAFDDLKHREVRRCKPRPDHKSGLVAFKHGLEIIEELRSTVLQEIPSAPFSLAGLFLVVEAGPDRVMGVVDLNQEVCNREFELMCP